ncbi:hypothetical protein BCR32DRAFT_288810 [Anaeromyces robustus]|uniref:Uncharacterized protein n=1 Tax=Anaeromyces robustus TaxID=1754192 RepID=A0A1Y1XRL8_9FUNG|nr:hypothetical protein BCR32DRAFT_288810 [Anaeromyces robustus]|eukprot:ORX88305.1 hypothetical protein BCR32DRAFT_288810 [Anaeromyces robustus]
MDLIYKLKNIYIYYLHIYMYSSVKEYSIIDMKEKDQLYKRNDFITSKKQSRFRLIQQLFNEEYSIIDMKEKDQLYKRNDFITSKKQSRFRLIQQLFNEGVLRFKLLFRQMQL